MRVFPGWEIPAHSDFAFHAGLAESASRCAQVNEQMVGMGFGHVITQIVQGADSKRLNPVVLLAFPLNMLTILKCRQCSNGAKHADISHAPGIANGVQRIPVPHGITDTHAGQRVRFGK